MKTYNYIIPLVVYPFDIMISIGQTDNELIKSVKRYGLNKEDIDDLLNMSNTMQGRAVMLLETNHSFIRLKHKPKTPKDYGTVSHEIFHAVDFLFRKINIPLTDSSDEAYAYLIGYITEQFYKGIE